MSLWSWSPIKQARLEMNDLHLWFMVLPKAASDLKRQRQDLLQTILKSYLGATPLVICKTEAGKPYLESQFLKFNLSHSQNYLLLGLQKSQPLGLDLECLHSRDFKTFASRFWGKSWYQDQLAPLPDYLKMLGFYHAWTQTEAWIKYHGRSVFRYPSFLPECLPLPQTKHHEHGLKIFSFMPKPSVIASLCLPQSITKISTNIISFHSAAELSHFIQGSY